MHCAGLYFGRYQTRIFFFRIMDFVYLNLAFWCLSWLLQIEGKQISDIRLEIPGTTSAETRLFEPSAPLHTSSMQISTKCENQNLKVFQTSVNLKLKASKGLQIPTRSNKFELWNVQSTAKSDKRSANAWDTKPPKWCKYQNIWTLDLRSLQTLTNLKLEPAECCKCFSPM